MMLVEKSLPASTEDVRDRGSIPGLGRSPGGGRGTHSSLLAWRIPRIEEPGGLPSMDLQSRTQLKQLSTRQLTTL